MGGGHHGDVPSKDIISNIINAANKKVKIRSSTATKKDVDERDIDREIEMRRQKYRRGSAPSESISSKLIGKMATDWLRSDGVDSTLSSSSRTLSSQTLSEDSAGGKHSNNSLDRDSAPVPPPAEHSNVLDRFLGNDGSASSTAGKAPPYTILSPSTQERIKRFETETKALLQHDLHTRRTRQDNERHRHELDRQRIEMEWQRAKRDLEQDDFLDELADNPSSDISGKVSDFAYKISDLNSRDVSGAAKTPADTSDYSSTSTSPAASQHSINQRTAPNKKFNEKVKSGTELPPRPAQRHYGAARASTTSLRRGMSAENIVDPQARPKKCKASAAVSSSFKYGGSLDSLREQYSAKGVVGPAAAAAAVVNVSASEDGM